MQVLSFAEIVRKYSQEAIDNIGEKVRLGRPRRDDVDFTHELIRAIKKEAAEKNINRMVVESEINKVIGSRNGNAMRPITVDEMFVLCERLGISTESCVSQVTSKVRLEKGEKE